MHKIFTLLTISVLSLEALSSHLYKYLVEYKTNYTNLPTGYSDKYTFFYDSNDKECKLIKNNSKIALFDPRYNIKAPKIKAYRCASWLKENYKTCEISNSIHVSSVAMSFGKYETTNLRIAFNVDHPNLDGIVEVKCTK